MVKFFLDENMQILRLESCHFIAVFPVFPIDNSSENALDLLRQKTTDLKWLPTAYTINDLLREGLRFTGAQATSLINMPEVICYVVSGWENSENAGEIDLQTIIWEVCSRILEAGNLVDTLIKIKKASL